MSTPPFAESVPKIVAKKAINYSPTFRLLSLLWPAALALFSMSPSAAVNPTAICFNNPDNYGNPHIHMWNSAPSGSLSDTNWPGQALTSEGSYRCYDPGVALTSASVIFNNGGSPQTGNLTMTSPNNCYQNGTWTTLDTCGLIDNGSSAGGSSGTTIYATNLGFTPNMHYFDVQPSTPDSAWPGVSMANDNGVYSYTLPVDASVVGIVFSNNGANQTADLSYNGGANNCYDNGTWKTLSQCSGSDTGGSSGGSSGNSGGTNTGSTLGRTTFVHLFEWTWPDVAQECEDYLGPKGFSAVQVSPPNEHIQGQEWWTRYQPVSYELTSRGGNRAQFIDMVDRCKAVGVDIYVDAVINHMAAGGGTGTAGSPFSARTNYDIYSASDFNSPQCTISSSDYGNNANNVRNCELVGLPDLATGSNYVRDTIAAFMNDLISIGVAGFRLDASKHMWPGDIDAILGRLNGSPYVFQEVIDLGTEAVSVGEYTHLGNVTEFRYSAKLGETLKTGNYSWLRNFGAEWGFLGSSDAVVFVDNHDNQRGHGAGGANVVTYKDSALYDLANVFMMALPYGYPKVMSSYEFGDINSQQETDRGGPGTLIHNNGNLNCFNEWKCEHRWRGIGNAVAFRNHTAANWNMTDWWTNDNDQIAFGRGDLGFVVINGEGNNLTRTFQTSLPAGSYCNTFDAEFNETTGDCNGETVSVNSAGQFTATAEARTAIMLHVGAVVGQPTTNGHAYASGGSSGGGTGGGSQQTPVAEAGANISITVGQTAQFDGSGSSDADGTIVNYIWSNGLTGASASQVYATAGNFTVTLTVTDDNGLTDTDTVVVNVAEAPSTGTTTIYAANLGFAPNMHYFDVAPTTADSVWPGVAMTNNNGVYSYTIPVDASFVGVVFSNNGANQTADLSYSGGANNCYDNGTWKTFAECTGPTSSGETTIYATNLGFAPTLHYFDVVPATPETTWPGVAMADNNGVYSYTIPVDATFAGVIFSNNGANQTADLSYNGGANNCYDNGTWKTLAQCSSGTGTGGGTGSGGGTNTGSTLGRTTFVHLFEWTWPDVAKECEQFLGPKGFSAVQVSPPSEHIQGQQWWTRYQPVSYELISRGGDRAQFIDMVQRCKAVGVDVYVDAIINHMAGGGGTGTAGSPYSGRTSYDDYSANDFNSPACGIAPEDYGNNANNVRNCELSGLPDLATGSNYVRDTIAAYMNDLIDIGVAGFRLDASKHMWPGDIDAILGRLNGVPYIFQEVIDLGTEAVSVTEYTHLGNVTEFRYSAKLGETMKTGNFSWLQNFGADWGFLGSSDAVVFVDNHDNQRGHGAGGENVITYKDSSLYDLANVFMMALPYGYPKVMSSYEFGDINSKEETDRGGPGTLIHSGNNVNCFNEWKCEHRWRGVANAVAFRNHTAANWTMTDWWTNDNDQIAFGRGNLGFVVINGEGNNLSRTFQTSLPAGNYCNTFDAEFSETTGVCDGESITVNGSGQFTATAEANTAIMLHVGAVVGQPTVNGHGYDDGSINNSTAPNAAAGVDITIEAGQVAQFDASASSDSDGTIVSYAWSNGLSGVSASRQYDTTGSYTVTLTVTDSDGLTDTDTLVVLVTEPVVYNTPTTKAIYVINTEGWATPTAHVWAATPAGSFTDTAWPGVALTDFGGLNAWYVEVGNDVISGNIIFNSAGTGQTADLTFSGDKLCYNNGVWMTVEACGLPVYSSADAGADRQANVNTRLALSAAASPGSTVGAYWTSTAWSGTLTGASVVTPTLTAEGNHTVTLTLADGSTADFTLSVVAATQGLPERPQLAAPLNFPLSGSVSTGNYTFEPAFPYLEGQFSSPVLVTNDGTNDLLYVVDKSGTVSVFPNDPAVTNGEVQTLLDIRSEVRDYHEQGLLSMAFDPDFANNRYAYIYYIEGNNDNESDNGVFGDGVLQRITLDNATNPTSVTSRVTVLRLAQPGPDHKGSMMQFHPATGEFYMSIGDGAYGDTAIVPTDPDPRTNNSSQDTSNLRGSFIRLAMRDTPNAEGKYYDIPADNPFVGNANVRDEIWSYGHRNPWRWAFDSAAPYTLWETEVGQAGFEEVNIIEPGANYGWPICEGTTHRGNNGGDPNNNRSCTGDLVGPKGGYDHDTGSVSIIGGFVYRGSNLPALDGRFIYGDYVSKKIWSIVDGEQGELVSDGFPANISSFGTGVSGNDVFISSHGTEFGVPSSIYRMVDSDAQAAIIPEKLSATGVFADLAERIPAHGVIEYDVNADGWFDGAQVRHFIAVPNDEKVSFADTADWDLPVGSVLVKHMELPTSATATRPYETSILFRQNAGNWASVNYRWNANGTEATRVDVPAEETVSIYLNGQTIDVQRSISSGSECTSCHIGTGSKDPLGVNTRQLNQEFDYQGQAANQLDVLTSIDFFSQATSSASSYSAFVDPADTSASLDERARAYLDTNCSHCHGGSFMDMNYDTPVGDMGIMNVERAAGVYRMRPFDHAASLMHTYQTQDGNRMPKGSNITNPVADQIFSAWIDAVDATQVGIKVNLAESSVLPGDTATLFALNLFSNGFEIPASGAISWSTSDGSILPASSSANPLVAIAGNEGQATITATVGGSSGSLAVKVGGGPLRPTNFVAAASSSSSIALSWTDNADDETSYVLSRSNSAAGPFSVIATLAANSQSMDDNGLSPETRYYYRLKATGVEVDSVSVNADTETESLGPVDGVTVVGGDNVSLIDGEARQLVAVALTGGESLGVTGAATWSSSDNSIVSVSANGLLTGGSSAGTAIITATYSGVTGTLSVTSHGDAQYVYLKRPADWAAPTIYVWTAQNGTDTPRAGGWPGSVIDEGSIELGGAWLRYLIPAAWANNAGETKVIFSDNGTNKTADLIVNQNAPRWFDGTTWLTNQPAGDGAVPNGTQVQMGNGDVTWGGNGEDLSGKLITPGATVDIVAHESGPGVSFVRWEGTGVAYLLDANQATTKMVVGDALSFTLLAVFDAVSDDHVVGRQYFTDQGCATCHGNDGNGSTPLTGAGSNYNLASLAEYIENNMPQGNAAACTGECATSTAALILANAYVAPVGACNASDLGDLIPQDRSFRLLSTEEYNNSVRDLLGLSGSIDVTTGRIPADIPVNGFKTNANGVFTDDYAKGYIVAAEAATELVNNIYSLTPGCGNASCFIQDFGKRAYRRPLSTTERNELAAVHSEHGDIGLMSAILSSPSMLYRSEVGEINSDGYFELTDYEVAAMLSYTYWATTPDSQLMALADAGQLSTPEQISAQVSSMLQDPRAEVAFERFILGWLDLDKDIKTTELSDSLKADMKSETLEFVKRTVFSGGNFDDLLTADYSYMTQQLAAHYGLTWPGGSGWQQVHYAGVNSERRGILGHAGILSIQSASEKTHPVKRGLFVRRNLMCQDFPPPPLGAALKPQEDPSLTVRERFEAAHLQDSCDACHQYIDGIGFGLENYNNVGLYVTTETTDDGSVKPINAAGYIGSLNSAETFLSESEPVISYQGVDELSGLIAGSTNAKACYARQWYRYTRGQREQSEDSCTLQVFAETFKDSSNASMLDLMIQFTQTKNYVLRK